MYQLAGCYTDSVQSPAPEIRVQLHQDLVLSHINEQLLSPRNSIGQLSHVDQAELPVIYFTCEF
jgi:hypothetical protein